MRNLSDYIEDYLKELIDRANKGIVEIQRRELAEMFECVPSQINYVLSTRFTPERGYIVESRRGGGGYIRIIKVELVHEERNLWTAIEEMVGDEITERRMESILIRLEEAELITLEEISLFKAVISRELLDIPTIYKDIIRAKLLKTIFLVYFGFDSKDA